MATATTRRKASLSSAEHLIVVLVVYVVVKLSMSSEAAKNINIRRIITRYLCCITDLGNIFLYTIRRYYCLTPLDILNADPKVGVHECT